MRQMHLILITISLFIALPNMQGIDAQNNVKAEQQKEYLSLVVEYYNSAQYIYVTQHDKQVVKFAIFRKQPNEKRYSKLESQGFEILLQEDISRYDNRLVFDLIAQYEVQGWDLVSHNFSTGKAAYQGTTFTDRVSYFLLSK